MKWRQKDQPLSAERTVESSCKSECKAELDSDLLIIGEEYEAHVRVKSNKYESVWSEWSPTVTWVSRVGKPKPPQSADLSMILGMTVAVVGSLLLALVYFKTDKTAWVYIEKKVKGSPLPDPGESLIMKDQIWQSPPFTNKSLHFFIKPEEFISVEVTCKGDGFAPCRSDVALLEKMKSESSYDSTNSSFSNPSYSHLDPLPPVPSLTAGNLEPCATDSPYGPVGGQGKGNTAEQDRKEEERRKDEEILQLLKTGSSNRETIPVILDYNRVEKLQPERVRLQSLDSGMCSGEEVSQESLEADSINMTDSHDEVPQAKEEREGDNGQDEGFQKLFGNISSGGIVCKGSIQVCSGYEPVQKLQADSNELLSLDSGLSSGGEEQLSQEESMEDIDKSTESTRFPFPPPSCALPCMLPFSTSLPLKFSGPGFSPAQQPLPCHLLERIALMSTTKSVEPSGDGYMPVTQKQS
ncbi:uncharacterized protein LOC133995967 [Scomber scombrus]|uniref:uncharacterized protein LOC133995967 n=1 Tax=Scomber scombrus TaxID=13677 RepID=UPI002DDC46AA|nr:uncharacterized protein LOC133995967 [Scomber scombrus]